MLTRSIRSSPAGWTSVRTRRGSQVRIFQFFSGNLRFKDSVSRFVEISPLWHKLKCLWEFYEGLFSGGQKLLPTLEQFVYNIIE